jgi:sirohydrochlorin cobaltochelatase
MTRRAIVLFAHGARDPRWAGPLEAVAAALRARRPDVAVALAFLELLEPRLDGAAAALVEAGAARIDVVPAFLGMGGHVRDDLPPLVERLRRAHPGVEFRLHGPLGERADIVAALADAAVDAVFTE